MKISRFALTKNQGSRRGGRTGFALVVTLTLMVLLTVIAVGLLTLGTVSLRASSQGSDMSIARTNARLALMLALGDLQKYAGADTRVTARADILDDNNPPVTGVWKSWEGSDHDSSGRPVAPDYGGKKRSGDGGGRFLSWLASGPLGTKIGDVPDTTRASNKIKLLGEDSVGTDHAASRQIYLTAEKVGDKTGKPTGSFAWWVSGENQKARLPKPYEHSQDTAAKWSVMAKTHAIADPEPFGLDKVLTGSSLNDPTVVSQASKAHTLRQGDLIDSKTLSQDHFHDLSTTSIGLLTNTATGGWRKDLSLASEAWESLPGSGLPMFRVKPGQDLVYARAGGNAPATAKRSLLYYWSDYRQAPPPPFNYPIYKTPAIGSWTNLVNYATIYKKKFGSVSSSGPLSASPMDTVTDITNGSDSIFLHTTRILPVIGRVQWVYSHRVVMVGGSSTLQLVVQPVITMWNPYNVRLDSPGTLRFELKGSLPPIVSYLSDGSSLPPPYDKRITLQDQEMSPATRSRGVRGPTKESNYTINNVAAFGPGETRVFSAKTIITSTNTATTNPDQLTATDLELFPGLSLTGGCAYEIAKNFSGSGKLTTSVEFNSEYRDGTLTNKVSGAGLYLNMKMNGTQVLAYRMSYTKELADQAYPPMDSTKFPAVTLGEISSPNPYPFLCVTFGARMATNTFLPSKGFVQSSPFVNYTAMGLKGSVEESISYTYPGTLHNVNSPFEYSFQGVNPLSTSLPQAETGTNRGFILTGITAAKGLKRCVIDELPGRPLNSLPELQNWDARFENPVPPFAFNLVGNSDATPLIPSDAVINSSAAAKGAENLQHDDSYCLNHALFDDWFFSSIAPEPSNFGSPSVSSTVKTVYSNFLTDPAKPLLNRSYKPIAEDVAAVAASPGSASSLATQNVGTAATSWKTIASRLEVEGMFNVNSTSVKAWRALLGHARNQRVPYLNASGGNSLSSATDYAVSRFTVAGDSATSGSGASGGRSGAEFTGYRVFEASQLDLLAEEIVKQVRARGPFLSLSEFVNRQLSSGEPALAGAVQTALNVLTASTRNPFGALQDDPDDLGSNISSQNPPPNDPKFPSDYVFKQAAGGYSLYGVPGWTRQADLLRPIAPILTVRDDTFTIRAYGDCRDASGTVVKASAICEATVRRTKDYVDRSDNAATADLSDGSGAVASRKPANEIFGRRFEIVSYRWLSPDEI